MDIGSHIAKLDLINGPQGTTIIGGMQPQWKVFSHLLCLFMLKKMNPGPIFLVPSLQEGGSKEMYKNDINKCYVYL